MKYQTYIHFLPATGEIIGWVSDFTAPAEPGYLLSPTGEPIDGKRFYVRAGAIAPRPENPATFGNRVFNNLPVPSQIIVNGTPYDCRERTATLELTYPGRYEVTVKAFPHIEAHFEVSK